MDKNTLSKANELDKKIKEYGEQIVSIRCEIDRKNKYDKQQLISKNCGGYYNKHLLEKFFRLIFKENKVSVQARYEGSIGIEISADEQLVQMVLNYLEEKKRQLEIEFESIEQESGK